MHYSEPLTFGLSYHDEAYATGWTLRVIIGAKEAERYSNLSGEELLDVMGAVATSWLRESAAQLF